MLKIGDKLVCIESHYHLIYNKIYTIIDVSSNDCVHFYYTIDDNSTCFDVKSRFSTYFIPLKELRKQKLQEICLI